MIKYIKRLFSEDIYDIKYITSTEWYRNHKYCPRCLVSEFTSTKIKVQQPNNFDFRDDKNKVQCKKCGWKGFRHMMLSYTRVDEMLRGNK